MHSAARAPFFATPAIGTGSRRLLLISYAFPPDSSIGALRWEKLVAFAVARGWTVDVIMMNPAEAELRDDSRLATLPNGISLWGVGRSLPVLRRMERWAVRLIRRFRPKARNAAPALSAGAAGWTGPVYEPGVRGAIRGIRREYLARMHYREWRNWARDAAAVGADIHRTRPFDLVISSGPPQMAHEAARLVARRTGVPFVMDIRDQFFGDDTQPPELRSWSWHSMTRAYERRCVEAARLVVMNTTVMEDIMHRRYPSWRAKFMTAMNGADSDAAEPAPGRDTFIVTNLGSLYNGRDPRSLLRGCRRAIDEVGASPRDFQIRFLGGDTYEGTPVAQIAVEEGVAEYLRVDRYKPRAEALQLQRASSVLVLLPQFQHECIPGKLFEFVQQESWLLALTNEETATAGVLRDSTADVVSPNDDAEIGRRIAQHYRDFTAGRKPTKVNVDGRFDREHQARILFDALDRVLVEQIDLRS